LTDPVVGARLAPRDLELVRKICIHRGEDVSDFVRRSIKRELARLCFLDEDEKKALEVSPRLG
jgi:hypothetical protein